MIEMAPAIPEPLNLDDLGSPPVPVELEEEKKGGDEQ